MLIDCRNHQNFEAREEGHVTSVSFPMNQTQDVRETCNKS